MSHAFRNFIMVVGAMIAIDNRAQAQCFVCSDSSQNTAVGSYALVGNSGGTYNAAVGYQALFSNTTGAENSAAGYQALFSNTTGSRNNATGEGALYRNTTANDNNAMGISALHSNSAGSLNNAMGNFALEFNTTGNNNNAIGYGSLLSNTTGSDNDGQGYFSLEKNTAGNLNIGVGYKAGSNLTTGSNNIDIGNAGIAAESNIIRIGTPGTQSATFVAAIAGTNISGGTAVMVSATGQLGVVSSSKRYKEDIQPMGEVSERLYQLHPVTFHYKQPNPDGSKPIEVGLVAEDVAEILPELVVYNSDGQPDSVAYHLLPTLLLNELQKEHQLVLAQARELTAVKSRLDEIDTLRTEVVELKELTKQLAELRDLGRGDAVPSTQIAIRK
jgi:Chaperone of endosialidase